MKRQAGFTLVELLVVIAILGILAVTAIPLMGTYRQRAYGSQATALAKQLVDGEIMYYLEHNKFVPDENETISIPSNADPGSADVLRIKNDLHVPIMLGNKLDYYFANDPTDPAGKCVTIVISAPFALFRNGRPDVIIKLFFDGRTQYY